MNLPKPPALVSAQKRCVGSAAYISAAWWGTLQSVSVERAGAGREGERRTFGECDFEFEEATLPYRLLLAWDAAIPPFEVHYALRVAHGLREEAEGVIASPLLPVGCSVQMYTE